MMVAPAVFVKTPSNRWLDASAEPLLGRPGVRAGLRGTQLPFKLLYADALTVAFPHRILEAVVG